jgi:hypothetical protein
VLAPEKITGVLNSYAQIPTYKLDSNPVLSCADSESVLPLCPLLSIMETRHRNRCCWRVRGTITVIKELEVGVRCKECYSRAEFVSVFGGEILTCKKHRCSVTTAVMRIDTCCEISWSAVVAVDDGGLEALIYIEGSLLQHMLEVCFKAWKKDELVADTSSTTGVDNPQTIASFAQFKKDAESVAVKAGSVKYTHSENSHRYVARDDCLEDPLYREGDEAFAAPQSHPQPQPGAARALQKTHAVALISRFLKCCKLSVLMEYVVKVIFPKQTTQGIASVSSSAAATRNVRKIKVQRSSTPGYMVDNVEFLSETRDSLKLRCLQVRALSSADIAIYAWNMWNSFKRK